MIADPEKGKIVRVFDMQKKAAVVIALLVVSVLGVSCAGNVSKAPPEEQLAALDAGSKNPPPELVEKFRSVLERLSRKCPSQSPEEIKKNIIQGQTILMRLGRGKKTLLEIAELMDKTIPAGKTVEKCDKMNLSLQQ
ncbi:MAG: hypothetical protein HZA28_02420 [Candidatus Omnitrophica bacterium]|nr:hypothetical protein [Candidatus Omnitrophota bacterium]